MQGLPFVWPLSGGLLIGLSAALYLLLNGRIAGISGLAAAAFGVSRAGSRAGAVVFLIGLLAGAAVSLKFIRQAELTVTGSTGLLVVGGLLVGFGTRLGSGCTSGHGVCGLARLSPRSMVATALFMAAAAATVFLMRHVLGMS